MPISLAARFFLSALPLAGFTADAAPAAGWTLDFNASEPGPLSLTALQSISPVPVLWGSGLADGELPGRGRLVDNTAHGLVLEVLYPAGAVGPRQGGVQWMTQLPPRETCQLTYRIRFSDDFEWVQGGKLPGLGGGTTPTGGRYSADGFTTRYMWRAGGSLVVYFYWAEQPSRTQPAGKQYGLDLDLGVTLERGREYVLRQRVTMNTPRERDGKLQVWVDDHEVLHRTNILFRDAPDKTWSIDRFYFSTFHGGAGPSWAPARDVTVQFDDIRVEP